MLIRPGTTADLPAVLALYGQPEEVAVPTAVREELFVVADDGGLVGFATGEVARSGAEAGEPDELEVSMVLVAATRRREGTGTALLEGLADAGWDAGLRSLSAWTSAPEFFEACGLERSGETREHDDGRTELRLTAELEAPARELVLDGPGIRLGQLLKFAGLVDTGADAKTLLAAEGVEVNGEVDTRRGRQLHDGDEVRAQGQTVVVRLPAETPTPPEPAHAP